MVLGREVGTKTGAYSIPFESKHSRLFVLLLDIKKRRPGSYRLSQRFWGYPIGTVEGSECVGDFKPGRMILWFPRSEGKQLCAPISHGERTNTSFPKLHCERRGGLLFTPAALP